MGKGEAMSKIKSKGKKRSRKIHLTDADSLLIDLEKVSMGPSSDASSANSLKIWYLQNKFWTEKQWSYAKSIVYRSKKASKPVKKKKFKLYAISDGRFVKLGYSSNIKSRIKAMQTGHPEGLCCIWEYYTGTIEVEAKRLEKKLHRFCDKYRVRGEWFESSCMTIVEQFKIREKIKIEVQNDDLDRAVLYGPDSVF